MNEELVAAKPWAARRNSLQPFSFEGDDLEGVLHYLVSLVGDKRSSLPTADQLKARGINSDIEVCLRVTRTIGLIERAADSRWIVTAEGRRWLDSKDSFYLASAICANVKFTGEQLQRLVVSRKESELLAMANNEYGMHWESLSQISERNRWFRWLGLVVCERHTHEYQLSERGFEFLEMIEPTSPGEAASSKSSAEGDKWLPEAWALDLCKMSKNELANRRVPIGRLPGGKSRVVDLLHKTASFLTEPKDKPEYDDFLLREGVKEGSLDTFRSVVKRLGFVIYGRGGYQLTDDAKVWANEARPIDLSCLMHANLRFSFELLQQLIKEDKTRDELVVEASVLYGIRLTKDSLSFRLSILESAGLIWTNGNGLVGITDRGRDVLFLIPSNESADQTEPLKDNNPKPTEERTASSSLLDLIIELKNAANDSSHSGRFEIACRDAFDRLGFSAERFSGPGNTDVLVKGQVGTGEEYAVAVDSKSSVTSTVDRNIDFVALENHRDKHHARYSLVIGPKFGKSTMQGSYAEKNGVAFMTVDTLCEWLRCCELVPLSTLEYKPVFMKRGLIKSTDIDHLFTESRKRQRIIKYVVKTLSSPTVLDDYNGVFTVRDFRASMIGVSESITGPGEGGVPSIEEIEEVLSFLAHPMVMLIEKSGNGFRLVGSLDDLSTKLACYMNIDANVERSC